jgi:hypothetical protein
VSPLLRVGRKSGVLSAFLPAAAAARVGRLVIGVAVAVTWLAPAPATAQDHSELILGLGGGMSYYSISTRADTGTILRGSVSYSPLPFLVVEGGARWHGCVDCHRFAVVEAGVQLLHRGERFSPFAAVGGGRSSDPEFMGTEWGLHSSVGSWVWWTPEWGLQLELRGRQVGSGAYMGELSAGVARRFWP